MKDGQSRADWRLVVPLGALTLTAYAVWMYGFGVQVDAMATDLDWSTGRLGIAFGGAQMFTGAMALAVGHWLDRRAPGPVLAVVGSIGSMLLLAASAARPAPAFAVLYSIVRIATSEFRLASDPCGDGFAQPWRVRSGWLQARWTWGTYY
jgi:hypothetical protein